MGCIHKVGEGVESLSPQSGSGGRRAPFPHLFGIQRRGLINKFPLLVLKAGEGVDMKGANCYYTPTFLLGIPRKTRSDCREKYKKIKKHRYNCTHRRW